MSGVDHKQLTTYAKGLMRESVQGTRDQGIALLKKVLEQIAARARVKYLTGGNPLAVRTGRLRASVSTGPIRQYGKTLTGTVGSDVFYGRVWEFGAQTPGHIVKPVNIDPRTGEVFKRLHFRLGPYGAHGEAEGPWVSPKQVKMDPKPWLAPAVEDSKGFMLSEIGRMGMNRAKGGGKGK